MSPRRVVVTGVGAVSAAGVGAEALMDAVCRPASCVRRIAAFDPSGFACQVAGEVVDFSANQFVPRSYRKATKVMARDIRLAVAATDSAIRDSGLVTKGIDPDRINVDGGRFACNIGAGLICADLDELGSAVQTALGDDGRLDLKKWGAEGMNNLTPLWLLKYLPNMLSCHVTIIHDLRGPSNTITCGEASAHLSIGEAWHQIQRGAADRAIAGGAESKLNPMGLLRQTMLKRLATRSNDRPSEACRPFDADADGSVIGEGGGLVVLEELEAAKHRGAKIHAEIVGFSCASDPSAMEPESVHCGNVHLAAGKALAEAGIEPSQLGLVIAQGSGTRAEDLREAADLAELLGGAPVPVISIAGAVGNCHSGHGGLTTAVAAMALARQVVPGSVNFATPAEGMSLNVPAQSAAGALEYALTHTFSSAGQSAAIVLKRYQ